MHIAQKGLKLDRRRLVPREGARRKRREIFYWKQSNFSHFSLTHVKRDIYGMQSIILVHTSIRTYVHSRRFIHENWMPQLFSLCIDSSRKRRMGRKQKVAGEERCSLIEIQQKPLPLCHPFPSHIWVRRRHIWNFWCCHNCLDTNNLDSDRYTIVEI